MSNAQEIVGKVQDQTLDAVRATQDVVVETVTAWTETTSKVTTQMPDFVLPDFVIDGELAVLGDFTKQIPTAEEVIDAGFDFAQQLLTNQRIFCKRIIAAATSKTLVTADRTPGVKAIEQSPRRINRNASAAGNEQPPN